jgi:hypothetical protein
MVDVKSKKCCAKGCKTRANFNKEGETKGLYCATHKLDGMVDIKHAKCLSEGCKKQPIFNHEGETKALYCAIHKLERMVDVKNKKCCVEGCKKGPAFNHEGETNAMYCASHKLDGMVDVKSKKCRHEGCKKRPTFNHEGQSNAIYCATHKLDGMVDIKHKTCIEKGCKTRPIFNHPGETNAMYCASHKLEGMVDIKNKTCQSEWCYTQVTDKYDGYCVFCYIHLFPDKPISRNYKTKEYAVVDFIQSTFPDYHWITDKRIADGCSKRRPDALLDLGYQILIVEVDENQHIDYDCSCENKRIMELSQDVDHRPIIFIRFNPDEYESDDTVVKSCWGLNNKGLCIVKKAKQPEWAYRLNTLAQQITYWSDPNNRTNKTIEVVQLFYDN